jgi:Sec7-like guanine-nucleotide exchange factor
MKELKMIYVLQGFDYGYLENTYEDYYEYHEEVNFELLVSEIKLAIINEIHRNLGKTNEIYDSKYIFNKISNELERRGFKLLKPNGIVRLSYSELDSCHWYTEKKGLTSLYKKITKHNDSVKMNEE